MTFEQLSIVHDGIELKFYRWGRGDRCLFLIHGFGDGGFVWHHFSASMMQTTSLLALDLRGHGNSGWSAAGNYDRTTYLDDLRIAMNRLELRDPILVGHSLGAELAIFLAAESRWRVRGLVLVDYGPGLSLAAAGHVRQVFQAQPWVYPSLHEYEQSVRERWPLAEEEMVQLLTRESANILPTGARELKCDPALKQRSFHPPDEAGLQRLLQSIDCEILLVRGAGSAFLPAAAAARMKAEISGCCVETVPCAGHAVMVDNPQGFLAAVRPFTDRIQRHSKDTRALAAR